MVQVLDPLHSRPVACIGANIAVPMVKSGVVQPTSGRDLLIYEISFKMLGAPSPIDLELRSQEIANILSTAITHIARRSEFPHLKGDATSARHEAKRRWVWRPTFASMKGTPVLPSTHF